MPVENYKWKRFCYSRGEGTKFLTGGYIPDPDIDILWQFQPESGLFSFDKLSTTPCVILLGEPGIGKSTVFRDAYETLKHQFSEDKSQNKALFFELNRYQSEDRVIQKVFRNPDFQKWQQGSQHLYLFLDGLDESLLRIQTIADLLFDEISSIGEDLHRLSLRIACRTAEFPSSLENELQSLWKTEQGEFIVVELAPLTITHVYDAALAHGIEVEQFRYAVHQAGVIPLARNPLTLKFLLNEYKKNKEFPNNTIQLYENGCLSLCSDEKRREKHIAGKLSDRERLLVAERLGALAIFTLHPTISIYRNALEDGDLLLSDLASGFEGDVKVDEEALRETLSTGLFSSRGSQRLGWAHQSYAEFLAARYLVRHEVPLSQILSMIISPADPTARIVPQLYETVAWIASMRLDVFQAVMSNSPEVLLRRDVAHISEEERVKLVESLLVQFDQQELTDVTRSLSQYYFKLKHNRLAEQLLPYISDRTKGWSVRQTAITIVEACQLHDIQDKLLDMVLDQEEKYEIRIELARVITSIGNDTTKQHLKVLLSEENDSEDNLKGHALFALWPSHLSAEELFAALTPPKREYFYGRYQAFLRSDFLLGLSPSDLPIALRWIETQQERSFPTFFKKNIDEIIVKAWECLDIPEVFEALTSAIFMRIKHLGYSWWVAQTREDRAFLTTLYQDDDKRYRILDALITLCSQHNCNKNTLKMCNPPLVLNKDFTWLHECYGKEGESPRGTLLKELICFSFSDQDQEHIEIAYIDWEKKTALADCFAHIFGEISLTSDDAKELQEFYRLQQEEGEVRHQSDRDEKTLIECITELLDKPFDGGALWFTLNRIVDSYKIMDPIISDIAQLPEWQLISDDNRMRLVNAAYGFIITDRDFETIYKDSEIIRVAYRAFRLLFRDYPKRLLSLPLDIWKLYASTIVIGSILSIESDTSVSALHQDLVQLAYQKSPDAMRNALIGEIEKRNVDDYQLYVHVKYLLDAFSVCLDEHLTTCLLSTIQEPHLISQVLTYLLEFLLTHEVAEAKAIAEDLVVKHFSDDPVIIERALTAGSVLWRFTPDAGWGVLWPILQENKAFGMKLMEAVASSMGLNGAGFKADLSEAQLADLYIWMAGQYPPAEDPQIAGARLVTERDDIAGWRRTLLERLQALGTEQAILALKRIKEEAKDHEWVQWHVVEAQKLFRQKTWLPLSPEILLKLVADSNRRIVENGDQLLDVLSESLSRLEAKLQGETPAAIDIWNEIVQQKKTTYRPKDENRFSDYVKRHLECDLKGRGIILNREVEFRRSSGGAPGERTDIKVDAVIPGNSGEDCQTITVIIEVKGCWNPDLKSAMKKQLVDRYLKESSCHYGLYLIGWFMCPQWDPSDRRSKRKHHASLEEARAYYRDQAKDLSIGGDKVQSYVLNTALR